MILRHGADGFYEIYDIDNNAILAGYRYRYGVLNRSARYTVPNRIGTRMRMAVASDTKLSSFV